MTGRSTCSTAVEPSLRRPPAAASGSYSFTNLSPGTYTIAEVVQAGWVITQPANPPGTYTKTTRQRQHADRSELRQLSSITVSGNVYNDLDGNGLKGSGEPGLQAGPSTCSNSSGNVLSTVTTDSNGNYSFTGRRRQVSTRSPRWCRRTGCKPSRCIRRLTASRPRAV